jgi:hypothetical protein
MANEWADAAAQKAAEELVDKEYVNRPAQKVEEYRHVISRNLEEWYQSEWRLAVLDRPEPGVDVQVCTADDLQSVAQYFLNLASGPLDGWTGGHRTYRFEVFTHWRPLFAPPVRPTKEKP